MDEILNPILPGFNPDPSIVRVDSDYFLAVSSFQYFPGIPIYHAKNLTGPWALIGHALTRRSQLDLRTVETGGGVWAPTIRYREDEGRFYVTTGVFTKYRPQEDERVWPRGFYVSTSNIWHDASWSDPVYFDQPGFDQDLFWDSNRTYLSTTYRIVGPRNPQSGLKDFAVHTSEIDLQTGRSLTPPTVIRKSPSGVAEGAHIFRRGGFCYLLVAEGGTESGHAEYIFRSSEGPLGPWQAGRMNPLWGAGADQEVQHTGHADVVEDAEGGWWAVCLGDRPYDVSLQGQKPMWKTSQLGRETFLMKVRWEDDWPVFNEGRAITLSRSTSNSGSDTSLQHWRDDFAEPLLSLGWYHKHTPLKREYSLVDRPSTLRLYGGPYNLSSHESPTMLLRKQTSINGIWSTSLDFFPDRTTHEAGIVLWWSNTAYTSVGIRKHPVESDKRELFLTESLIMHPGSSKRVRKTFVNTIPGTGTVRLLIRCTMMNYRFGFALNEDEPTWIETIATDLVIRPSPMGMDFAGMMLGLYSFGDLEPCLCPADYHYAQWEWAPPASAKIDMGMRESFQRFS